MQRPDLDEIEAGLQPNLSCSVQTAFDLITYIRHLETILKNDSQIEKS